MADNTTIPTLTQSEKLESLFTELDQLHVFYLDNELTSDQYDLLRLGYQDQILAILLPERFSSFD